MRNLNYCLNEIKCLNSGEEFLVKDLFKGYEWNRLDINQRRTLGTIFLSYIQNNKSLNIAVLNKTSSNQQKYKKL